MTKMNLLSKDMFSIFNKIKLYNTVRSNKNNNKNDIIISKEKQSDDYNLYEIERNIKMDNEYIMCENKN